MGAIRKFVRQMITDLFGEKKVNEEMPGALAQRYRSMLVLAAGTMVMGIIVTIASIKAETDWRAPMIMFVGMALLIFGIAAMFRRKVLYIGYATIEGEVTNITRKFGVTRKTRDQITSIHITDAEHNIYKVPIYKKNMEIPLNSKVMVYIPKDDPVREFDGLRYPTAVWGVIVTEEPVSEKTSEGNDE